MISSRFYQITGRVLPVSPNYLWFLFFLLECVFQIKASNVCLFSLQAKEYGSCVAAKVPQVEKDMCLKEFLTLRNCMQNTVFYIIESVI